MKTMPNKPASFVMSKRTAGLLGIALSMAAWGYKAEAAPGLALVSITITGTIMGFFVNRPLVPVSFGVGKHVLEPRSVEKQSPISSTVNATGVTNSVPVNITQPQKSFRLRRLP